MGSEKRYRYPGINFYTKEDRDIFCGRTDDALKLFNRVMLNNTLVLHGESGTGKSSLVQAGLIPLLEEFNEKSESQHKKQYLPLTIRLDSLRKINTNENRMLVHKNDPMDIPDLLVSQTLKLINEQYSFKNRKLPYIEEKADSFWYIAKLFEKNNFTLLLIFDQFEEMQGFTKKQSEVFSEKLSELFVSTMPETIYKEYDQETAKLDQTKMSEEEKIEYNENIKFLEQPLNIRILFVIREDKLGTMSLLADYFPDILKNDFILLPLDKNCAGKAIVEPAQKHGNFIFEPFNFDKEAVNHLLQNLADTVAERYDPIQLQIVCSSIERKIANKKRLIKTKDIPPVGDIIRDYYYDTWKTIKTEFKLSDENYEKKRKAVLEQLVIRGSRNQVMEKLLVDEGNELDKNILKKLVTDGLLRKIPSGMDMFYQLSHDRLISPLSEDLMDLKIKETIQNETQEQALKIKRRGHFLILVILSFLIVLYEAVSLNFKAKKEKETFEENRYMLISNSLIKADNPTLSYLIARDLLKKYPNSSKGAKFVNNFDSSSANVYLRGIYPSLSEVVSAKILDGNRLSVYEKHNQYIWDIKMEILPKKIPSIKREFLVKRIQTLTRQFEVFKIDLERDTVIIIKDETGKELKIRGSISNLENIAISPDNKYLLFENDLYRLKDSKKIAVLFPYKKEKFWHDSKEYMQCASIFLSNNRIAVAYENGKIRVFEIEKNPKSIIKAVTTIESDNNILSTTYNNRITTLAIGGRNHYLLAANAQKSIYVFDISKTRINEKITAPYFSNQVAELEGHYSPVICMSVSKDNKLLLSGSRDNTAILWDLENMKKITTLKVQNSGQIKYVGFSNNNQDLVTISDNNIVYVWKRGQASNLYNNGQLYRFSPFNYAVWGLKENEYCFPQDTVTTLGLYNAIINYILNMHLGNKYLRDESNNNSLKTAVLEIKNIHLKLTKRKDFNNVVVDYNEALLNQRFYEFLLSVPSKQNDIEYSILKAKYQLAEWKIFLLDTIETNNAKELLYLFSNNANSKVDRQRSDADDLKLLKFYRDSVLSPLNIKYSQNTYLIKFKKWVDFQWLKYYLNTGKFIEALSVVNKLSNENPNAISYKIYLVATYLGTDKYIDAAKLYRNILNINNKGFIEQIIRELFNRLKEKNIALFNINKFEKEYGLEKLLEEQ